MKINNVKPINKGILICRFDLELDKIGITIKECVLMNGSNGKWINFPSRQYEKDGEKKWFSYIYMDKEKKFQLEEHAIPMILNMLPECEPHQEQIPF